MHGRAYERKFRIFRKLGCLCHIGLRVRLRADCATVAPSKVFSDSLPPSNPTILICNVCTCQNPRAFAHSKKNPAGFLDTFEHFAICAAANALCCEQARALAFSVLDLLPRFFKPIAAKIGLAGNAIAINFAEFFNIVVAKFAPHKLVAEKRRIADNDVTFRPCPFGIDFEKLVLPAVFLRLRGFQVFRLLFEMSH